jgi:LEA14-like dessication related protein
MILKNLTAAVFKKPLCLNTRLALRLAAVIVCASVLCGCAVFNKSLESPRISLSDLTVQESSGFEAMFEIQLRVLNPNDIDLNILGLECKLEINDKPFAYGLAKAEVKVPAYGSATLPVTMYSSIFNIARGLLDLPLREELSYLLKGRLRLDGTERLPSKVSFKSEGTIPFKDLTGNAFAEKY